MRSLADPEAAHLGLGHKARRLVEIAAAGHAVPPGLIITPDAFDLLDRDSIGSAEPSMMVPATVRDELRSVVDETFRGEPVVVRSSSTSEDSPFASAAGMYASFLGRRTCEEIVHSVGLCYASVDVADARFYRSHRGLDGERERMGVIIQRMIDTQVAGVLFTCDPVTGAGDLVIESTEGLGTAVVAGRGIPTRHLLDRDVPSSEPMLEALRLTAIDLERLFGAPQDIEWGWFEGTLFVFQSRDIVALPAQATAGEPDATWLAEPVIASATGLPVSPGVAIGRFSSGSPSVLGGPVLLVDRFPASGVARTVAGAAAIITREGGVLSHAATVMRELGCPAVHIDAHEPLPGADETVVVDASTGRVARLADQPPVLRKQLVFEAVRTMALRGGFGLSWNSKVEAVCLDTELVRTLLSALDLAATPVFDGVQEILPYDHPERVYCGISARLQTWSGTSRLQFMRARPAEGSAAYRRDEEVVSHLASKDDGRSFLAELGYVPRPRQERLIRVYEHGGCRVQLNWWPGAYAPYVGVEGPDEPTVRGTLQELGADPAAFGDLNGKHIFDQLGISLVGCEFDGAIPSYTDWLHGAPL